MKVWAGGGPDNIDQSGFPPTSICLFHMIYSPSDTSCRRSGASFVLELSLSFQNM